MVETKQGNNTRISLAFNVFVKGNIGNVKNLTYLKLIDSSIIKLAHLLING
jgi:hypothetical protein